MTSIRLLTILLLSTCLVSPCVASTDSERPPPTCDFRDTNWELTCDIYAPDPPIMSCPGTSQDDACYDAWLQYQRAQRCVDNPSDPICIAVPELIDL